MSILNYVCFEITGFIVQLINYHEFFVALSGACTSEFHPRHSTFFSVSVCNGIPNRNPAHPSSPHLAPASVHPAHLFISLSLSNFVYSFTWIFSPLRIAAVTTSTIARRHMGIQISPWIHPSLGTQTLFSCFRFFSPGACL